MKDQIIFCKITILSFHALLEKYDRISPKMGPKNWPFLPNGPKRVDFDFFLVQTPGNVIYIPAAIAVGFQSKNLFFFFYVDPP